MSLNNPENKLWWFIPLPALAMWVGWGVRGQLGHWTGAMIPGALLGLALSILLKGKRFSPGLVVGLAASGYGFGAAQTTLQTAGYLMATNHDHVVKLGISLPGLAIKGGLWATFVGTGLGLALVAYRYSKRDVVVGLLLLVAAFYAGWWVIDRPRLIYFSVDRPEIWGGLLVGVIPLLAWVTVRGGTRIPLRLAGYAALAGGLGYPFAVSLAAAGINFTHIRQDWWKLAETTFGACMGAGIALGTYRIQDQLPVEETKEAQTTLPVRPWDAILGAALAVAGTEALARGVLPWIILGALLWCAAFYSAKAGWQIGVTMTFFGTVANLVDFWSREQKFGHSVLLWALAGFATLVVAWKVARWSAEPQGAAVRKTFLSLLWAIVGLSFLVSFVNRAVLRPTAGAVAAAGDQWPYLVQMWHRVLVVEGGFTVAAVVLTWLVFQISHRQESAGI
jgi:hypothetical protein